MFQKFEQCVAENKLRAQQQRESVFGAKNASLVNRFMQNINPIKPPSETSRGYPSEK